jgi:hypothetical protein
MTGRNDAIGSDMAQAHCSKTGETHTAIAAFAFSRPVDGTSALESIPVAQGDIAALTKTSFASAWTLQ